MRFTRMSLSLSFGLAASLGLGCDQLESGDTASQNGSPAVQTSTDATFSRTVVVLGPDGTQQVSVEPVTAAEIERMKEERAHPPAKRDDVAYTLLTADCSNGNSMWLFDQANRTGNMLCLIRNGAESLSWANLSAYQRSNRLSPNWSKAVRSFWAGNEIGFFHNSSFAAEVFGKFQQANSVSATVQSATVMGIAADTGAVRSATFQYWRRTQALCKPAMFSVIDRTTGQAPIFNVSGSRVGSDCLYSMPFNASYGHVYDPGVSSCGVTPIEAGLAVPPSSLSGGVVHFLDDGFRVTCSVTEPTH